jgi:hypothetical protein
MDQITPIILDKENIPPDAHGNHSHVGIGTATSGESSHEVHWGHYINTIGLTPLMNIDKQ